jgi:hypothetical protein
MTTATVITAIEELKLGNGLSVFLAGAIDMGSAVDWQSYVIDKLSEYDNLTIVNPRRPNFTPDTLDEQIHWELKALEEVDIILMWFPKDAKAPISFFEAGLYLRSGKIVIGAEDGFYRRRNLEITSKRYGEPLLDALDTMILEVACLYEDFFYGE